MKSSKLTATLITGLALLANACGSASETTTVDSSDEPTAETAVAAASDNTTTTSGESAEPATESDTAPASGDEFPEITRVDATSTSDGTWNIDVTVSSPYDSPERYADAWRVLDQDGNELGILELSHDHAGEQPFTRSLEGVEIPEGVKKVTVEGRDSVNGWGGQTFLYNLPDARSY